MRNGLQVNVLTHGNYSVFDLILLRNKRRSATVIF